MWCDTAVPILWKTPMGIKWELEDIENIYPKANEFWIKFARTIFFILSIKSKELIKKMVLN